MSSRESELNGPFLAARRTLGVSLEANASDIKRAYRAAVAQHPPDREPEEFGRIRAAFELLSEPLEAARTALVSPAPACPPPVLAAPARPGDVLLLALRHAVGRLPADAVRALTSDSVAVRAASPRKRRAAPASPATNVSQPGPDDPSSTP